VGEWGEVTYGVLRVGVLDVGRGNLFGELDCAFLCLLHDGGLGCLMMDMRCVWVGRCCWRTSLCGVDSMRLVCAGIWRKRVVRCTRGAAGESAWQCVVVSIRLATGRPVMWVAVWGCGGVGMGWRRGAGTRVVGSKTGAVCTGTVAVRSFAGGVSL